MSENAIHLAQSAVASVIELQARVAGLETRLASLSGQVHALGSTVTPQGQTVTGLTNSIKSEVSARSAADTALGSRIENYRSDRKGADAVAISKLEARVATPTDSDMAIATHIGGALLRVGMITPFKVTVDGQVYINEAFIDDSAIRADIAKAMPAHEIKVSETADGRKYATGFGVGIDESASIEQKSAMAILEEISSQISESELGKDLASRIAELEQGKEKQDGENRSFNDRLTSLNLELVARRGEDSAARVRTDQRIDALQAQVDNLQGKVYSRG